MTRGKGLVHVYTGKGKGKTSAAFGLALRMAGHGKKVCIVQFLKGFESGEAKALGKLPGVRVKQFGRKAWKPGMKSLGKAFSVGVEDKKKAFQALEHALKAAKTRKYGLLVLDEANVALKKGLISMEDVLELIESKPASLELVLTGRNAPKRVLDKADYVTEFKEIKHPMKKGVQARKGIEY